MNDKILLVRYPHVGVQEVFESDEVASKFGIYPPLGLALLAGVLREHGYEVKILDGWSQKLSKSQFREELRAFSPGLVGLTLWTQYLDEIEGARLVRETLPDTPIIVGGPHVCLYPEETISRFNFVDYAVQGEGEETIIDLIEHLKNGNPLTEVNGLAFRQNGRIILNSPRPPIRDLDEIPFPAFDMLPLDRYHSAWGRNRTSIHLLSSRGCPFSCAYCSKPQWGRGVRFHSADYIVSLMSRLYRERGVQEIHFYDDTFTVNKKRVMDICRLLLAEKLKNLRWTIRTRADSVDREILFAIKEAGCFRVGYGVESGDREILKAMNRTISPDQARKAIALTKEAGMETVANYMIGYKGESKTTYKKTLRLAKELDTDMAHFSITTVMPNSDLYYSVLAENPDFRDAWREFSKGDIDHIDTNILRFAGKDYSINDLDRMIAWAYFSYYFRPRVIWRFLKRLRSSNQLFRNAFQAWGILRAYLVENFT